LQSVAGVGAQSLRSRQNASASRRGKRKIAMTGYLVAMMADRRLFAKVQSIDRNGIVVEFFKSVANREVARTASGNCVHTELPKQTRVFVDEAVDHWRVGRIVSAHRENDGSFTYEVKFPNGRLRDISETSLFVRSLDEFADPADILAAGCAETQFYADRRRRALRRMRCLQAASQGLTGLVSGSIELVPHQARTVRRVLSDISLRYLLADEVGLGKTIEAGAIIRQILLDGPSRRVAVLVPRTILPQWQAELENRFFISDFGRSVQFVSHEDTGLIDAATALDLLVVDEAHNLLRSADNRVTDLAAARLTELANRVPRLLLLSATPPLGEEDRLLGLLNLLDPVSHPLADREGFRRKLDERQKIGRLLLPLLPGRPGVVLRQQAQQAIALFPSDPTVRLEAQRILEAGTDRKTMDDATEALRDHIVRSYRLHTRLLRTRRSDVEDWFRPRGPATNNLNHVRFEFWGEMRDGSIGARLEAWRLDAARLPENLHQPGIRRWLDLIEASWQGPLALRSLLTGLGPLFEGEQAHLASLLEWAQDETVEADQFNAIERGLVEWKRVQGAQRADRPPPKIVCFVSDADVARRLLEYLQKRLGRFNISFVLGTTETGDRQARIETFENDLQAWVLLSDRAGEEGLNLQFARAILHVDLPLSPSRLEQRIGRLDRFGRKLPEISHRIIFPDDDEEAPWRAWFDLLANGFGVFNSSISDVQFRLDPLRAAIAKKFFTDGTAGLQGLDTEIQTELKGERQKLDEQAALDRLAQLSDSSGDIVESIENSEDDEVAISHDLRPWIEKVLQLSVVPDRENGTLRIFWGRETLLPETPWRKALESALDTPSTWRRRTAQNLQKVRSRLLRPGSAFFEGLERLSRWDDRGISYATWRVDPGRPEMWRGFRLVWVVEPGLPLEGPVWAAKVASELHRRCAAWLPTSTYEQLVDETGAPVTHSELRELLLRDYGDRKGVADFNLGGRPDALRQAIDPVLFAATIKEVRDVCKASLERDPTFVARRDEAMRRHSIEDLRARRSLNRRNDTSRAENGCDLPEYDSEMRALDLLASAIKEPTIRLDEIGFLVLAGDPPESGEPSC
jgi:ATP-dependent helicase HepA